MRLLAHPFFFLGALTALVAVVACDKSAGSDEPALPPAPTVDRNDLAAAGYYTYKEAVAAWDKRKAEGAKGKDGSELVGTRPKGWYLTDWVGSKPLTLGGLLGRVVVVRFWTSPNCPFCEKTLPALQTLAQEFADKPVTFVGAYHAKPANAVLDMKEPSATAADWKVSIPMALDREWQTLRAWWLSTGIRNATSVTFIIGKDGRILFVHPGPVFHPSSDPSEAKQNRDYIAVREAILAGLAAD